MFIFIFHTTVLQIKSILQLELELYKIHHNSSRSSLKVHILIELNAKNFQDIINMAMIKVQAHELRIIKISPHFKHSFRIREDLRLLLTELTILRMNFYQTLNAIFLELMRNYIIILRICNCTSKQ